MALHCCIMPCFPLGGREQGEGFYIDVYIMVLVKFGVGSKTHLSLSPGSTIFYFCEQNISFLEVYFS